MVKTIEKSFVAIAPFVPSRLTSERFGVELFAKRSRRLTAMAQPALLEAFRVALALGF